MLTYFYVRYEIKYSPPFSAPRGTTMRATAFLAPTILFLIYTSILYFCSRSLWLDLNVAIWPAIQRAADY